MSFLERQESARLRTRLYTLQFALLSVPCVAATFVATFFSVWLLVSVFLVKLLGVGMTEREIDAFITSPVYIVVSGSVCTILVLGSLIGYKRWQLRRSSRYMAGQLLAVPVTRTSQDPGTRRLYNIGQEMALAAGLAPPSMYIWNESAVNSLTVGWNPDDAAIFVTRGAIDTLTRDEMQALVGHGMSQVLNGDMALNVRLAAYLYAYKFAPRVAKWWLLGPFDLKGFDFIRGLLVWALVMVWVGLALSIITFPAYLAARLLQGAVGRERQKLADASAVQFTRNPDGLKGALLKAWVLGSTTGRPLPILDDLAHGCFAPPVHQRVLRTHQPFLKRVRTLDPRFTAADAESMRRRVEAEEEQTRLRKAQQGQARRTVEPIARVANATAFVAEVSLTSLGTSGDARAVLLALLLDRKPEIQKLQLEVARKHFGEASMPALAQSLRALRPLTPDERTLALDTHLATLRDLPVVELRRLTEVIPALEAHDDSTDVFEYAIARRTRVFIQDLLEPRQPHGNRRLAGVAGELAVTLSVLAQHGGAKRDAAKACAAGFAKLGLPEGLRFTPQLHWVRPMDAALAQLLALRPIDKQLLIDAMQTTVLFDQVETSLERELVRVIAASLHCPLPRTDRH